jgi:sugar lactone lactonase YvrE
MSKTGRIAVLVVGIATLAVAFAAAQNHAPNPYTAVDGWGTLPAGRTWGATSAVFPAQDGSGNIWVGERCGENLCAGKPDVDPILLFDNDGNLLDSFGAGMILWPHGMFVDSDNNVWVTDAVGAAARGGAQLDKGHTVLKFSPAGELLMTIGTPGVSGTGTDTFNQPSDVLVAPDGSIFVADGHGAGGNNRIVKFSRDGRFLMEWGETGREFGQFRDPHALALDAEGRLYVGDRDNSRIQIFTQEGEHIATWTQFGRPSGLFIDADGILYSTDSESNARRNQGWKRGIRIGSVSDGLVTAFIPDPEPNQDNAGTSAGEGVAVDAMGNVYSAEVGPRQMRKFVRR